jgi:hypothetical protein
MRLVSNQSEEIRVDHMILRLLEAHNRLAIESMGQQKDYLYEFLKSLKLEEIGARRRTGSRNASNGFCDRPGRAGALSLFARVA